jgi:hypothetical protein
MPWGFSENEHHDHVMRSTALSITFVDDSTTPPINLFWKSLRKSGTSPSGLIISSIHSKNSSSPGFMRLSQDPDNQLCIASWLSFRWRILPCEGVLFHVRKVQKWFISESWFPLDLCPFPRTGKPMDPAAKKIPEILPALHESKKFARLRSISKQIRITRPSRIAELCFFSLEVDQ